MGMYEDSAADVQSERQPDENMKTDVKEVPESSPPKESKIIKNLM